MGTTHINFIYSTTESLLNETMVFNINHQIISTPAGRIEVDLELLLQNYLAALQGDAKEPPLDTKDTVPHGRDSLSTTASSEESEAHSIDTGSPPTSEDTPAEKEELKAARTKSVMFFDDQRDFEEALNESDFECALAAAEAEHNERKDRSVAFDDLETAYSIGEEVRAATPSRNVKSLYESCQSDMRRLDSREVVGQTRAVRRIRRVVRTDTKMGYVKQSVRFLEHALTDVITQACTQINSTHGSLSRVAFGYRHYIGDDCFTDRIIEKLAEKDRPIVLVRGKDYADSYSDSDED